MKLNRSPWMAMLWSMAIPGFGQIYNQDYLIGILLIILEFVINVKSNLNLIILYSFQGSILDAQNTVNIEWLLFYPCVYTFSLWHAYNKAAEINLNRKGYEGQGSHAYSTRFNGIFVGAAMGGTLGIIYVINHGPVFGGIIGMLMGALIGEGIEKIVCLCEKRKILKEE